MDYTETYVAAVKLNTVKVLLPLSAKVNLDCALRLLNVNSALPN